MIDQAIAELLTQASQLAQAQVRPTTESIKVADGQTRLLYTLIDAPRTYNDDGSDGILAARYQIDYDAPQLSLARLVADRVRLHLDGFRGTQTDTYILRVSFPNDRFAAATRDPGAAVPVARYVQTMVVVYRESA